VAVLTGVLVGVLVAVAVKVATDVFVDVDVVVGVSVGMTVVVMVAVPLEVGVGVAGSWNSSAPISGVVTLLVSASMSSVMPDIAVPAFATAEGISEGTKCRSDWETNIGSPLTLFRSCPTLALRQVARAKYPFEQVAGVPVQPSRACGFAGLKYQSL
jgi:hypothetical protein